MNTDSKHTDSDLWITAYLSNDYSPEDIRMLKSWIEQSEENKAYFLRMQEVWFAMAEKKNHSFFNKEDAYKLFLSRINSRKKNNTSTKKILRYLSYAAATVGLLFIISYTSYRQGEEKIRNRFADVVIEAPLGSRTRTFLPDGSLVWLNAGSKITYSQGFGMEDRSVNLVGEGYFEVVKNSKLAFEVRTSELNVEVIGTKFNFRNYADDEEATVSLLEGKVLVNNILKEVNQPLSPNQRLFLNKKTGDMRVSNVIAQHTTGWTDGILFFDEVLLPDIIKELQRSYNVKIHIEDSILYDFRFYGNFFRKEHTIKEIMEILVSTNKLTYMIDDKEIKLKALK